MLNLTVNPTPSVSIPPLTVVVGSTITLQPQASPDVTEWQWTPADYLTCTTCADPVCTPLAPITYIVTVTNNNGCMASDSVAISLKCSGSVVFIPNTFTPDGDGLNDIFYPRGKGIKLVKYLRIFNRWGELIFEQRNFSLDDISKGWDGRYKGKMLDPDVFVYITEMVCDNNENLNLKGTIMLIR
jgi:gliding motility-associated-like protein